MAVQRFTYMVQIYINSISNTYRQVFVLYANQARMKIKNAHPSLLDVGIASDFYLVMTSIFTL